MRQRSPAPHPLASNKKRFDKGSFAGGKGRLATSTARKLLATESTQYLGQHSIAIIHPGSVRKMEAKTQIEYTLPVSLLHRYRAFENLRSLENQTAVGRPGIMDFRGGRPVSSQTERRDSRSSIRNTKTNHSRPDAFGLALSCYMAPCATSGKAAQRQGAINGFQNGTKTT